jgi:hypothetical protein
MKSDSTAALCSASFRLNHFNISLSHVQSTLHLLFLLPFFLTLMLGFSNLFLSSFSTLQLFQLLFCFLFSSRVFPFLADLALPSAVPLFCQPLHPL